MALPAAGNAISQLWADDTYGHLHADADLDLGLSVNQNVWGAPDGMAASWGRTPTSNSFSRGSPC